MSQQPTMWFRVTIETHDTEGGPQPGSSVSAVAACYADEGDDYPLALATAIEAAVINSPDRQLVCDADDVFKALWDRNRPTEPAAQQGE